MEVSPLEKKKQLWSWRLWWLKRGCRLLGSGPVLASASCSSWRTCDRLVLDQGSHNHNQSPPEGSHSNWVHPSWVWKPCSLLLMSAGIGATSVWTDSAYHTRSHTHAHTLLQTLTKLASPRLNLNTTWQWWKIDRPLCFESWASFRDHPRWTSCYCDCSARTHWSLSLYQK